MRPVTERTSPCAVDHTAWTRFPTSKRPLQKARCCRTASAPSPAANTAVPAPTRRAGRVTLASARSSSERHRRPEDVLGGARLVGRAPRRGEPLGQPRLAGDAPERRGERDRIARRDEQRVGVVGQELTRGGGGGGDQRASAGERLEDLVRDHARRLLARAEDPERAPGGAVRLGQLLVVDPRDVGDVRRPGLEQGRLLAVPDDADLDLGRELGGREDRLEPVERDQLADEEGVERLRRMPAGPEEGLVGADEGDRDALVGEPEHAAEERGVRLRVRDHEVGGAEGGLVDGAHDAGGGRPRPEPPPVADERVVQRDEWVEDDRPPPGDAAGGGMSKCPG